MKKYVLKTHGCKANQLESAVIKEKLDNAGYSQTDRISDADIFILNSCSVTGNSDIEALRTLRNAKNKNKNLLTVFTGCSAQLHADKLKDLSYIDVFLGNDDKFSIVKFLENKQSAVNDIFKIDKFNNQLIHTYNKTRGYLKIQDGCNNYCSYCTIPLARGNSRSNTISNIVEQINIYIESGIKEIVLTGIHIGQWGPDIDKTLSLYNLLEEIEKTDIQRYRLGSLNTLEVDEKLLKFLSKSDKFCPHFHLSLQSLTDKTLRAMNRHYTARQCLDLMEKIQNNFDLPFIGSDIIVGFPGETDVDFKTTVENVNKSFLTNIHVFPYSIRENTKAASMPDKVDESTKQKRADILHRIAGKKYDKFVEQNIEKNNEILIEKRPDKKTGLLKGVTKNYLTVYIDSYDETLLNTIQKVKILNTKEDKIFCNIIEE